jgi:hypothetical protein
MKDLRRLNFAVEQNQRPPRGDGEPFHQIDGGHAEVETSVSRFQSRLTRRQCRRPAEVVVQTGRLHNNRSRQHKDDLQQRPGRKDLVQQRHVMLPRRPYTALQRDTQRHDAFAPETQKSPAAARPPGGIFSERIDAAKQRASDVYVCNHALT